MSSGIFEVKATTPPPGEKVLLFLEKISASGGASKPPSVTSYQHDDIPPQVEDWLKPQREHYRETAQLSQPQQSTPRESNNGLASLAESQVSYRGIAGPGAMLHADHEEDARSTVQERSVQNNFTPRSVNIDLLDHDILAPTPIKPVNGSSSSFGHRGPLPGFQAFERTPNLAANVGLPASEYGSPRSRADLGFQRSAATPSIVGIDIEGPSQPGSVRPPASVALDRPASRQSHKSDVTQKNDNGKHQFEIGGNTIEVSIPTGDGPPITVSVTQRPTSHTPRPKSPEKIERVASPTKTEKSVARSKAPTEYPPLPFSPKSNRPDSEDWLSPAANGFGKAPSSKAPSQRAPSRAGSVALSVSPSQAPTQQNREPTSPPKDAGKAPSLFSNLPRRSDAMSPQRFAELGGLFGGDAFNAPVGRAADPWDPMSPASRAKSPAQSQSQAFPSFHRPTSHHSAFVPTAEDVLNAAVRGRAMSPGALSAAQQRSLYGGSQAPTGNTTGAPVFPFGDAATGHPGQFGQQDLNVQYGNAAGQYSDSAFGGPPPGNVREESPGLDENEQRMLHDILKTPRTSRTVPPSILADEVHDSHFHDEELCLLLHAADDETLHEVVRKVIRKAIRSRIKNLNIKYDPEALQQYKDPHQHVPARSVNGEQSVIAVPTGHGESLRSTGYPEDPPAWAKDIMDAIQHTQQRLDKMASGRSSKAPTEKSRRAYQTSDPGYTPHTATVPLSAQPTGGKGRAPTQTYDGASTSRRLGNESLFGHTDRGDSPGQQYLEQELYRLRVKDDAAQSERSHRTWEVARDDPGPHNGDATPTPHAPSNLPDIPDFGASGDFEEPARPPSAPLPPLPEPSEAGRGPWGSEPQGAPSAQQDSLKPWQRVHQRLLNWTIMWPLNELDNALHSTLSGQQLDDIALTIWTTQVYKRYVRDALTDDPPRPVNRLFVPPTMADAINNAVYNGRHGDACGMLRDLWGSFGFEGAPKLIVVLARHRRENNHWVVHRFSLQDGGLQTYDTFPDRSLPDGRPLGWWFAIRIAWPHGMYPSPDHLVQKVNRLHRPLQLSIDNSVAAAGIWRNVLMGSRPERSVDLERLRDLINTEVRNLRQRKEMGKLSVNTGPKPNWD